MVPDILVKEQTKIKKMIVYPLGENQSSRHPVSLKQAISGRAGRNLPIGVGESRLVRIG